MIVRTAADLDALPGSTVVLDNDGDAWQKNERNQRWWRVGTADNRSADRVVHHGPFRTMRPGLDVVTSFTAEEITAAFAAENLASTAPSPPSMPEGGWRDGDAVVVTYEGGWYPIGTWIRERGRWISGSRMHVPIPHPGEPEIVQRFIDEGRVVYVHAPRPAEGSVREARVAVRRVRRPAGRNADPNGDLGVRIWPTDTHQTQTLAGLARTWGVSYEGPRPEDCDDSE